MGPKGTFSESAALKIYPGAPLEYFDDIEDVFRYAEAGKGPGVVAIENSLEGSVGNNLESLMRYDVKITGEAVLDIRLYLMAKKGVTKDKIKVILSHPHVFGQCREYLSKNYPNAVRQASTSTAEAIREASSRDDAAAVGYRSAGLLYGLTVLAEGVQDTESQTRFVSISKDAGEGKKTSLIFAVKDEPGALYSILKLFSDACLNLTKIESRPSRKKLGEYVFFLDYENKGMPAGEREMLHRKIIERTTYFKDLGSY